MKYLDTTDLPSDPNGSLGEFRRAIRMAYNNNRDNPEKLDLLQRTMNCVLEQMCGVEPEDQVDLTKATVEDDPLGAVVLKRE